MSLPDRKVAALSMVADGNSIAAVSNLLGVPETVVADWIRNPNDESLASTPSSASDAIPRPAVVAGSAASTPSWGTIGYLAIAVGALVFFVWGTLPIVIDDANGSPSIDQLHRTSGWVKTWRDCTSPGRNLQFESVTLVEATSAHTVTIPCVLPQGSLSDGKAHRMTVLTSERRRVGTVVYDVELDGRTLLAYADVKRVQDNPRGDLAFLLPVLAVLLAVLAAAIWRYRAERSPRHEMSSLV